MIDQNIKSCGGEKVKQITDTQNLAISILSSTFFPFFPRSWKKQSKMICLFQKTRGARSHSFRQNFGLFFCCTSFPFKVPGKEILGTILGTVRGNRSQKIDRSIVFAANRKIHCSKEIESQMGLNKWTVSWHHD